MSREWSARQALFFLIGSTALTLVISLMGYSFWKKYKKDRLSNETYLIRSIIQTGPEKEALKTGYLAEILNLSADKPDHLYAISLKEAEKKLLRSPLIKEAKVRRLPPSTLYIDYEVRRPIAWLADFKNTAVDLEGHLFPVSPFFTPKQLPEIYLGLPDQIDQRVNTPAFILATKILKFLEATPWTEGLRVLRVDVSNANAESLGQREVVLITEEEMSVYCFQKILRLSPKDYEQQLSRFLALRRTMMDDYKKQLSSIPFGGKFAPRIIDLRLPHLAFVQKG